MFIQFNRDATRKLTPLPMKHVDTGTGLERVASVLQSLENSGQAALGNYDIDLFQTIIAAIEEVSVRARSATAIRYGDRSSEATFRFARSLIMRARSAF